MNQGSDMSNNRNLGRIRSAGSFPRRQNGAVTMFSAVLILLLLTEMVIYAVSVGLFEQRKSGSHQRGEMPEGHG